MYLERIEFELKLNLKCNIFLIKAFNNMFQLNTLFPFIPSYYHTPIHVYQINLITVYLPI